MAKSGQESAIKVFCRFRPLNALEIARGDAFIPILEETNLVHSGKNYAFSGVFGPTATQEDVYKVAASDVVANVLEGYNGTIFAYGQTSSGKTHTMEGYTSDWKGRGVIARVASDLFDGIMTMDPNLQFIISISSLEIYNERIQDLLNGKNSVAIQEDHQKNTLIKGLEERFVASPEEIVSVFEEGKKNRVVANTRMNEVSSRSHSVLILTVKQTHSVTKKQLTGRLHLVDLAGSEKSGAEGQLLKEAKNINRSLSTLGLVITALATKKSHVPYRDSKLTRILQQSLGGNSQTTIIICASPSNINEAETRSTLMFGSRAITICNSIAINEEMTVDGWKRRYEMEVTMLNKKIESMEMELKRLRSTDADDAPTSVTEVNSLHSRLDENEYENSILSDEIANLRELLVNKEDSMFKMNRQAIIHEKEIFQLQKECDDKSVELNKVLCSLEDLAAANQAYSMRCATMELQVETLQNERDSLVEQRRLAECARIQPDVVHESAPLEVTLATSPVSHGPTGEIDQLTDRVQKALAARDLLKTKFAKIVLGWTQSNQAREEAAPSTPLDHNLDVMLEAYKQLQRENFDLRVKHDSLAIRLRVRAERITWFEENFLETKKQAQKDRKKFQEQIERLMFVGYKRSRGTPQIIKPVRPVG